MRNWLAFLGGAQNGWAYTAQSVDLPYLVCLLMPPSLMQLQAFFLVADDIMDGSHTRRGQPCWFRKVCIKAWNPPAINILNKTLGKQKSLTVPPMGCLEHLMNVLAELKVLLVHQIFFANSLNPTKKVIVMQFLVSLGAVFQYFWPYLAVHHQDGHTWACAFSSKRAWQLSTSLAGSCGIFWILSSGVYWYDLPLHYDERLCTSKGWGAYSCTDNAQYNVY